MRRAARDDDQIAFRNCESFAVNDSLAFPFAQSRFARIFKRSAERELRRTGNNIKNIVRSIVNLRVRRIFFLVVLNGDAQLHSFAANQISHFIFNAESHWEGAKSVLIVSRLSADGTKILDDGVMVFDGHDKNLTVEGPKFYKRSGFYYTFAPAGGVETGWQLVLRSKIICRPYEEETVLAQGKTKINGTHQGAWVSTQTGEERFVRFQDKTPSGV